MIGQTLGHYKIVEKLGAGGMGEVYRAEDSTLKRQVALKVLPPDLAASQERLERFQREAESLASLNHPNIVMIHTVEETEGVRFLTMELVEGKQLSALIPKGGMPLERIFEIAVPLADALAAAHDRGVIHRDLKPANIMVTEEGRVKVLDFGLAKLRQEAAPAEATALPTEPLTEEGKILGTVTYMSPEQVEGKPVDHRSDIFSLGVVLYEMATGERPFQGDSSISLIAAIMRDSPREVDSVRDDIPHHLCRIIRHCLEKDLERRYQTAKDVRNELQDLRQEIQSGAVTTGAPEGLKVRGTQSSWLTALIILMAVAAVGLYLLIARPPAGGVGGESEINSVAVLPLINLSHDSEQDYFIDGMTEALISSLAKIESLKVISRQSVMRFKGSEKPLPEIARELDVDAVVEGSALLVGDRVRITAQLIEGASDQHLWSESYERPMADILRLQTEVARAIAGGIKATLTPQDKRRLSSARLVDPEAHQLYLKGRFHWNKKTQEGFDKSIEYYKQALEIDSESALSYAGLAATYADLANWGRLPMIEVVPKAKAAALTALEIDPTLGEAHRVLAQIAFLEWDWSVAGDEIEKAIELNPNDASAHHLYSFLLTGWRPEEAIQEGQRAQELDPLSTPISVDLGRVYYWARDYDQAIEEYRNVLELSPDDLYAQWALGVSLAQKGRYEEAIATFMGREVPTAHINYALGWAYGLAGRREEATQVLEALLERSEEGFVPPGQIAYVHLGLGDEDKVFEWLEKAYKIRDPWVIELRWNPAFDSVRDDPRSKDILRRMNLPE